MRIIKNCPCSLQAWIGADEPVLDEMDLYFSCKNEVKKYLNKKLQKFEGETVECYIYQYYKDKPREIQVSFDVKRLQCTEPL